MDVTEQTILDEFNKEIATESQPLVGVEIHRTLGTCKISVKDVTVTKQQVSETVCKSVASHFGVKPSWQAV